MRFEWTYTHVQINKGWESRGNGCVRFSAVRTIHKWLPLCGGMSCFAEVGTLKVLFQPQFTSINHASWKHCTYLPWYPGHISHTHTACKTNTCHDQTHCYGGIGRTSEQPRCSGAEQDRPLSWSQLAYPGCCGFGHRNRNWKPNSIRGAGRRQYTDRSCSLHGPIGTAISISKVGIEGHRPAAHFEMCWNCHSCIYQGNVAQMLIRPS